MAGEDLKRLDEVIREVGETINGLGCLKVEEASRGPGYVSFKCTCLDDQTWRTVMEHYLLNSVNKGYRKHICYRPYVVTTKKRGGKSSYSIQYFWMLQFSATDLSKVSAPITHQMLKSRVHAAKRMEKAAPPRKVPPITTAPPEEEEAAPVPAWKPKTFVKVLPSGERVVEKEVLLPWPNDAMQKDRNKRGARAINPDG